MPDLSRLRVRLRKSNEHAPDPPVWWAGGLLLRGGAGATVSSSWGRWWRRPSRGPWGDGRGHSPDALWGDRAGRACGGGQTSRMCSRRGWIPRMCARSSEVPNCGGGGGIVDDVAQRLRHDLLLRALCGPDSFRPGAGQVVAPVCGCSHDELHLSPPALERSANHTLPVTASMACL